MSVPVNANKKKRKLEDSDLDLMQPRSKRQKQQQTNNNNNHNRNEEKVEDDEDADSNEDANEDRLVGPMSPRMLYRLHVCAEVSADMARDGAHFVSRQPQYDFDGWLSDYLPVRFRKEMYKSFWMGYCQCFEAISEILKRKQAPNVSAIHQELQNRTYDARYTRFYLNKGGLVEYAIDAIIKRSKEESCPYPVGDETFFEIPEFKQEHDALPEMKDYDFEYDMVWEDLCASTCMVFELHYGGPYRTDDEPDEDEDDDDGDDDLNAWYQRQSHHVLQKLLQSRDY